jgi:signal transduction histidine kinase/DNA-binding response OmpR family regulator/CHASE3 domain sensor protein
MGVFQSPHVSAPTANPASNRKRSTPFLPLTSAIGFAVALAAIAVIAFFSWQALQMREESAKRVTHTLEVIQRLQELMSSLKDAETSQRGFLLTGDESYLRPYNKAKTELPGNFKIMRGLIADNPLQQRRLEALGGFANEKMQELAQTIELRRAGSMEAALSVVRLDRGKALMEEIRLALGEMQDHEKNLSAERQAAWREAVELSSVVTWGGSALLLFLILVAAAVASRDFRQRETQIWLRTGQMGASAAMQGELRLDVLGENILSFLAAYLDAQVGAVYIAEENGSFRRFAGYAIDGDRLPVIRNGENLLGQTAKENRPIHVRDVPGDYLPVASALGRSDPRELLMAPASVDREVFAIVELGFFHAVRPADLELLALVSESLGIAVRSAKDRSRLEELFQETQRQAEELQAQQEELRVNNEELEEQGRVLTESQAQLEAQQAELEQTNAQLEEHMQALEHERSGLAQAQAVLTEKAEELERVNQYKSEFLANMSHELRTPLNSTLILAKLLSDNKEGNLTPEQVQFARTISSAGDDLLALINDILDLAKIESGNVDVDIEPLHVGAAVEALVKNMQPVAQQKKLDLSLEVEPDAPATIETDSQRLGQILKNLLSNALKFTAQGSVAVRVYADDADSIAFAVRDTGIGIPAQQQDIIFEAFRQADGSTHRKYGGTGLGLSISRDLARLLGGDLTVASQPGQGSVFTLKLPRRFVEQPRERETEARRPAPVGPAPVTATPIAGAAAPAPLEVVQDDRDRLASGSRLILVIEDDARFAAILSDLAHERGFQCVQARNAAEGLAAAAEYRPSAIVLDMNLPDQSGLAVLDQLKQDSATRHIPVHIASVVDYSQEAMERGAIGYALKPVKRQELVEAFERLEAKFSQSLRRVLVVEDDERQRESIRQLLANGDIEITGVASAAAALEQLQAVTFDCVVMDLHLPDMSGFTLLEKMAGQEAVSFPPVIVYTGRSLSRDEEQQLRRFSRSIIIKDARSPERLLDEVTLFLHQVEDKLPPESQRLLKVARHREATFDGRNILIVEDDVRNIFALSSVLEPKGAKIQIARNGLEALQVLERNAQADDRAGNDIDLVLMDIMMPEMDGYTAIREIRKRPEWKKIPIIALTAKAMRDDQEKCLAAGASDYMAKPLDVERLLSLVRVWMPK